VSDNQQVSDNQDLLSGCAAQSNGATWLNHTTPGQTFPERPHLFAIYLPKNVTVIRTREARQSRNVAEPRLPAIPPLPARKNGFHSLAFPFPKRK
jgi:hypothetical protein